LIQATPAFKFLVDSCMDLQIYPEDVPIGALSSIYPFNVDKASPSFISKKPNDFSSFDMVIFTEFRGLHSNPQGDNVVKPKMKWWEESESDYHIRSCCELLSLHPPQNKEFIVSSQKKNVKSPFKKVGLAPCGNQPYKKWPYFSRLANALHKFGIKVTVFGQSRDFSAQDYARCEVFQNRPFESVVDKLSEQDIVIANDCGLMHAAAATGVKTFAIFGPTSTTKNAPNNARVISNKEGCKLSPCQEKDPTWRLHCMGECLSSVTVEAVVNAIHS